MHDPNLMLDALHAQQRDLDRKAELDRQRKDGREQDPALGDRVLIAVADALIAAGSRMKSTHQHQPHHQPATR